MRKLLLILTACILLSGCSLFKRTEKKVDKSELFGKTEQSIDQKKESKERESKKETKSDTEQTSEREQKDLNSNTKVEADEILIDKEGNIHAKGNAKVTNNTTDKGTKDKTSNKALQEDKVTDTSKESKEDNKVKEKQENKQSDSKKETVTEASGEGIIFGAVAVLIIVFGLLWWFGVKRKS